MAMIKRITLTIAKNNASVKLSQNLRFYRIKFIIYQNTNIKYSKYLYFYAIFCN